MRGFLAPGGEHRVAADLYLGYGLPRRSGERPAARPSRARSRSGACASSPAEDERLLGALRARRVGAELDRRGVRGRDRGARAAIARGDVYQVNLVQHLAAPFAGDPLALAGALAALRPLQPRPFAGDGWAIVSASPELFLARRGTVWTMPIKGTRPLGRGRARTSAKDAAEHVMIVDLERNDLSRVCEPGSVRWPELMAARARRGRRTSSRPSRGGCARTRAWPRSSPRLPRRLRDRRAEDRGLDQIAALEPVGRGASMGALGVLHPNGDFDLALTIRTFAVADGRDPPLGRRRHRLGLRAGGRDRGVVGQGAAAARSRRRRWCRRR